MFSTEVIMNITRGSMWVAVAFQFLFVLIITVLVGIWLRSALSRKYTDENVKVIKAVEKLKTTIEGFQKWMESLEKKVEDNSKSIVDVDKRVSLLEQLSPSLEKDKKIINLLLVDDQDIVTAYYQDYIKNLSLTPKWKAFNVDVDVANTYNDAIKKLTLSMTFDKKYDAVITDICLDKNKKGWDLEAFCGTNNLVMKNGKPNFVFFTADPELKNIPQEYAERFLSFDSNVLEKPNSEHSNTVFDNKLFNMIEN